MNTLFAYRIEGVNNRLCKETTPICLKQIRFSCDHLAFLLIKCEILFEQSDIYLPRRKKYSYYEEVLKVT